MLSGSFEVLVYNFTRKVIKKEVILIKILITVCIFLLGFFFVSQRNGLISNLIAKKFFAMK